MSGRELDAAVARVLRALDDPGRNPVHHRETRRRHEREWRTLHDALSGLRAAAGRAGVESHPDGG